MLRKTADQIAQRIIQGRLNKLATEHKYTVKSAAPVPEALFPFAENALLRMGAAGVRNPDQDPLELATTGLVGGYSKALNWSALPGMTFAVKKILEHEGASPFEQPVSVESSF